MNLILLVFFVLLGTTAIVHHNQNHIYYGELAYPLYYNNKHKELISKLIIFLTIIVFAWLCAERNVNSNDTKPYIDYFQKLDISSPKAFFIIDGRYQIGYEFLNKTCKLIFGNNYKAFFALVATMNCLIVYCGILRMQKTAIPFLLYLGFFGLYYNFIVLRQGIAISFAILALSCLNKHTIKPMIFLIIGMLFHDSIVICFLFFIIKFIKKGIRKEIYLIILFISLILYLTKAFALAIEPLFLSILKKIPPISRFAFYVRNLEHSYDISIMFLIYYATTFMLIMKTKQSLIYNRLLFINTMGLLILGLFSTMSVIVRISDYFYLSYIFLIPMALDKKPKLDRYIIMSGYFILTTLFYVRFIGYGVPFEFF